MTDTRVQPAGGTAEHRTARGLPVHQDLFRGHPEDRAGRGAQQRSAGRMPFGGPGQQDQEAALTGRQRGVRTDI